MFWEKKLTYVESVSELSYYQPISNQSLCTVGFYYIYFVNCDLISSIRLNHIVFTPSLYIAL